MRSVIGKPVFVFVCRSLPLSDALYPMLVLIGPNGIGTRSLAQKLVDEFPNYFGYA